MRRQLNIQAIQQRWPWIMWPAAALDWLLTPRRWARLFGRAAESVATRFSNALTPDSSRLARFLVTCFGWVASIRAGLIANRPSLMRVAWAVRQFVWSVTWAFIVIMRLWPRKVPVPADGNVIRSVPAPESYPDFQSPRLVVPSDVPYEEMTLPGAITVQALHVLQDVYPVIASHQPIASSEPEERIKEAYPWVYRLVRPPPRWHPDLAAARAQGNLLGALAVGGPFAKLLERRDGTSNEYAIDLEYLHQYPVRDDLARLGCTIQFTEQGGRLKTRGISHDGQFSEPGTSSWAFAERIALCSLATHTTVWRHGMQYHVGGVAAVAVLTYHLPPAHPLRRLLAPHLQDTLSTNYHTHLTLRRSGFDVTGFSFNYDTILRYYDDGASYFNIARLDPRGESIRRGIDDTLYYPYRDQALRYVALFESYVREYVDHYYADESALAADTAAHTWFDAVDRHIAHGLRGYVSGLTKANLVGLLALFVYSVSVEHEDNTLWNYAMFLPATVRRDGVFESVGQVQSVVNFQLVISSAANKLMTDASHVALDPGAVRIMQRFQSNLAALQRQMDAEPDRYWQISPRSLEGSISA